MFKKFKINLMLLSRLVGMSVITVFAIMVMIAVNLKGRQVEQVAEDDATDKRPALVSVLELQPEAIEIEEKYSGTVRPFERIQLSFKTVGRVMELGKNKDKQDLDVGDVVKSGQVLARLDTRVLEAQMDELQAAKQFAQHEFDNAEELWESQNSNSGIPTQRSAISETQFRQKQTELKVALARIATLQAQIDDGILVSNVDGVISKRLIQEGESVGMGQTVFEVIQVDQVKLVVGVPESRIRRMLESQNRDMLAKVDLIGQSRKGTVETRIGNVSQIGEASDEMSGLFEVEILLDNKDRYYRPGMIAIARIVVDNYDGFRIPLDSVFVRSGKTYVFTFAKDSSSVDETDSGQPEANLGVAKRLEFENGSFEYQDGFLVTAEKLSRHQTRIITDGHRRLVENRNVKKVSDD